MLLYTTWEISPSLKKFTKKYKMVSAHLNERTRRIWAATEAKMLGYGGVSILSEVTGLSRTTIHAGMNDLTRKSINVDKIRKIGGGRKKLLKQTKQF